MPVRHLKADDIIHRIVETIGHITYFNDPQVKSLLQQGLQEEKQELPRDVLHTILSNLELSPRCEIPLCQDTGSLVVFAEMGNELYLDETLHGILNRAMSIAQNKYFLRASQLSDPLFARRNTGDNTPVILHMSIVRGNRLKLMIAQKGGGAENMSRLKMFTPSAGVQEIGDFVVETVNLAGAKACPPLIVGLGLGGNFETCASLAKRALFDPLDVPNPQSEYAKLELELLERINATGIGAQGMGGRTTCLAVKIRTAPCHIASLPAAVNLQCHAHRHAEITF